MTQTIAIVGAGPGLGLAIGRRFGREGFQVALIARDKSRIEGLARTLKGEGIDAAGFVGDVTDETSLAKAFQAVKAQFGAVDVLEFSPMPPPTTDVERSPEGTTVAVAERQMKMQLLGAIASVRQVLPEMLERKAGTILITTGLSASVPIPFLTPIAAAMAASRQYALCLNAGLAGQGVFVGTISIGVLIGSGDPGTAAADIAEKYYALYQAKDRPEILVTGADDIKKLDDSLKT